MKKKTTISKTDDTILKLKVLAEKKEGVRRKLVVTAKRKENVRGRLRVTAKQLAATARGKEGIRRKLAIIATRLAVTAKENEEIRRKLEVTAKKLAATAEEKESIRRKLLVTAEKLDIKAKQLAATAKEKESVRRKLVVTAEKLAVTANEKESIRRKLEITAEKLAATAKEKESIRRKLVITAKQLAVIAKEKEGVRRKLEITAKQLAVIAKEKEEARSKLAVTAEKLATTAEEKEETRSKLAITAKQLAATAKEKEDIRSRLEITAKQLATTAEEREDTRSKLAVTAKQLATTAEEKEDTRSKLAVTAKQLATTARERENVRGKLVVTARKLAATAKEREGARRKLAVTAKQLASTAKDIASANKYARSLIEASLDPLVTISPAGKITDVNEATVKVTGVSRKKLIGTDFLNYFTEPVKARERYKQVFKEGFVTDFPLTIRSQAGKLTDVLYNASVYKDDKGNVLGVFAAARDVTEAKKANELIESANMELRSLDVAKDEFVSIASHQLRTPLTALKGFTGMLLDGDAGALNDKQREYLTEIKYANERMIKLITSLLNVSRVDLGVFAVNPEPVNFERVSESVIKELELKIKEKNLVMLTNYEKDLPLLSVDSKITRMIFQNLLSNAVKYTPREGTISIDIKKSDATMLISVADTGYGIPQAAQSKIFKKLFRADNARTKDPDGTGLGLYIIKETIEQTGGKIWFKSKENQGSTFYVSIPLGGMRKKGSKILQ